MGQIKRSCFELFGKLIDFWKGLLRKVARCNHRPVCSLKLPVPSILQSSLVVLKVFARICAYLMVLAWRNDPHAASVAGLRITNYPCYRSDAW